MGLFNSLRELCFGPRGIDGREQVLPFPTRRKNIRPVTLRAARRCHIEALESRRLMAGDVAPQVLLGSIYFEEATGDDSQPDVIEVSFVGGAAGTTLDRLTISGDKHQNGLTEGDIFFDTAAGGLGVFDFGGLVISSANGFTVNSVIVVDGGTDIVFNLSGFDAGEKLKFSVDADEAQFIDGNDIDANSLVEGAEFQRSIMIGEFSAPGYVDLTLTGRYWDSFNDEFAAATVATGLTLPLPNDAYTTNHDFSDRTAAAVAHEAQIPLATLSGWVYHDRSDDGVFDTATEEGIGGVTLELIKNGVATGITTVTSSNAANLGYYEFLELTPGTYGVREVQPANWLDGKDTAGSHGGAAASEAAGPADRIDGAILNYGDDGMNYNFGELLPGSIRGNVHASNGPDCIFRAEHPCIGYDSGGSINYNSITNVFSLLAAPTSLETGELFLSGNFNIQIVVNEAGSLVGGVTGNDLTLVGDIDLDGDFVADISGTLLTAEIIAFASTDSGGITDTFELRFLVTGGLLAAQYADADLIVTTTSENSSFTGNFTTNFGGNAKGEICSAILEEQIPLEGVRIDLLDANGNFIRFTLTDANGDYEFTGLTPGTYQIREHQPTDYFDGGEYVGTLGGASHDSVGVYSFFTGIEVGSDQHGNYYDFCEKPPASIRGRVHADHHEECDFDDPEILLEGVVIELLDADGNLVATTTTDANGEYVFEDLAPGEYQVHEIQPANFYDGGERVGTAGGLRDGIDTIHSIVLHAGLNATQYDFCEKVGVTLSGNVYHDRSNDGVFNRPGEEGIGGVELKLLDAGGVDTGRRATTNSAGFYQFLNLAAGVYTVVEVHPAGWLDGKDTPGNLGGIADLLPLGDRLSQITINWGDEGIEYNFGELLPGSISGRVHADDGPDCNFDDPHVMLEDVPIDLLDAGGIVIDTTFTNADGEYEFTGLAPGVYSVREHQPEEYFDGGERVGTLGGASHDVAEVFSIFTGIDVGSDEHGVQYDFCEKPPASISGRVHADEHEECDFDHPEILLEGVVIELRDADGNLVATTTTDANGEYHFDGLRAGEYQIHEIQPEGYYDGGERVGTAGGARNGIDSILSIFLDPGIHATDYDFCERVGVMLSGNVYHDRDNDGVFDRETEQGIGGVVLKLLDFTGADTGLRATTNVNGFYKFNNLAAGTYAVMEVHPAGWFDGKDTPGNLGGVADLSPAGDMLSQITINWAEAGVEYNFGELLPGSISGRVHADDEPNCTFDDPHVFLEGVQIDLLDAAGNVIATTLTDAQGEYEFTGLRPGTYGVREHQPVDHFDGGERVGSSGGAAHDEEGFSIFTGIDIGSDEDAIQYDFCEKPPAELSGYVFIDGGPIFIEEDETLTPEQIAAVRNGLRTADDTPLAGVVLELRQGISGDPIFVNQTLLGHYPGGPDDAIQVVTDANGFYHFTGLPAGTYAVVEVQPEGVIDNIDRPGTLGGFAVNPLGLFSSPSGPPAPGVQSNIEQFREQFGNNVIMRIPLTVGLHSQENNFSEVVTKVGTPLPPPETPDPPERPPVFGPPGVPYVPPLVLAPIPPMNPGPDIFGGSSQALGFTWHLSVVNAGWPRSITPQSVRFQLTSAIDVVGWTNVALNQGHWTLAKLEGDQIVVLRDEIFGRADASPVTGDFNGDGVTDLGVFIDGQWFLDLNGNGVWDEGDLWAKLGGQDDVPVTGDWDADGKTDIGIYGPAWPRDPWAIEREPGLPDADNFPTQPAGKMKNMPPTAEEATDGARLLKRTAQGKSRADLIDHVFHYGAANDLPVTGDWNGDGIRQIGVFRDGQWNLDLDGDGRFTELDAVVAFGQSGDRPIVGDFNADGIDEIGVFRAGQWLVDTNQNRELDAQDKVFELGGAGDLPVVGDWNDDGSDDPGVYQPGEATDRLTRRAG